METNLSLETDLKQLIIETLNLADYAVSDISSTDPLFGEGLGLDSIDALELGIMVKKKYNIAIDVDQDIKEHFYSVKTLAKYINQNLVQERKEV